MIYDAYGNGLKPGPALTELVHDTIHLSAEVLKANQRTEKNEMVEVSEELYAKIMEDGHPEPTARERVTSAIPADILARINKYKKRKKALCPRITPADLTRAVCKKFNIELT